MICIYSSVTFDIVFISKVVLCLVPVAVSKWFLYTPFLLWILGNATSLLWDVTQPLACVIEETVLGELNRGLKRRRVHADPVSTLSSWLLIFHPVNTLPVLFPDTSPFFFVAILVIEPTLQETQRKTFSFFFNSGAFCRLVIDQGDLVGTKVDADGEGISCSSELFFLSDVTA